MLTVAFLIKTQVQLFLKYEMNDLKNRLILAAFAVAFGARNIAIIENQTNREFFLLKVSAYAIVARVFYPNCSSE
jgi:hypothetical protein